MIIGFRHRALKTLFERGDRSQIRPDMIDKVERILQRLDVIETAEQMNLPGYRLHALSGNLKGFWSVTVNGNWRIIFRIDDGDVAEVELIDYH